MTNPRGRPRDPANGHRVAVWPEISVAAGFTRAQAEEFARQAFELDEIEAREIHAGVLAAFARVTR